MSNSFKQMIKDGTIKRTDVGMFIRLEDLHVKQGFNKRIEGERLDKADEELYQFLKGGGKVSALEVVPREAGGVEIVEGHRRTRTYRRLDKEGLFPRVPSKEDQSKTDAWVAITPFVGNDLDKLARIWTSNNQLELTISEQAMIVKDMTVAFNLKPDEIARIVNKKRQHIDFLLTLIAAPHEVQVMVRDGIVAADAAVETVREHGEKAGEVLRAEAEKARAMGKNKTETRALVTKGTIHGRALPKAIVTDMTGLVHRVVKGLPEQTAQALDRFRRGESSDPEELVTVSVADLLALAMCSSQIEELKAKEEERLKQKAAKQEKDSADE